MALTPLQLREWFARATDEQIQELLDEGLEALIVDGEQDDAFGTEGFNKRFA